MTYRLLPLLALVAAVPGTAEGPSPADGAPTIPDGQAHPPGEPGSGGQWTQLSIHERIVIRIPRLRRDAETLPPPYPGEPAPRWVEKRGARCVQAEDIAGATVSRGGSVDLVLGDGQRARALLEADCPALDYYLGFYIKPTPDGRVCAGRDAIRSRSGAVCPIRAFRRLVPGR